MVLRLVVAVLHYMFRPTWPSSGEYYVSLFYIPEGICFAVFVAFSCILAAKQIPSGIYKSERSHTLDDGHVSRNM
jgi:hypothetical protein